MTNQEIEECRQRLVDILSTSDEKRDKVDEARKLAQEVGASIYTKYAGVDASAAFSELVANIHNALQTASMINMGKTAAKNCKIALTATIIAILSMLAAWAAVVVNLVISYISN